MTTIEQHCQSIANPRPAAAGEHLHWNGEWYQTCPLADWCPWPSCHEATPADLRESRRRELLESAEIGREHRGRSS